MAQPRKPPTPSSSDPLPEEDEDQGPISGARPSSPPADPSKLAKAPPIIDEDPVTPDEEGTPQVTRELFKDFLATQAARDRIMQVIAYRCGKGTPPDVLDDIFQATCERLLEDDNLPRSVPRMRPWISKAAQWQVIDFYRARAQQLKWENRAADVNELPPDPTSEGDETDVPVDPTAPPRPVVVVDDERMTTWLDKQKLTAVDKVVLEAIRHKARSKASNEQVATRFGMSLASYESRHARFTAKWVPAWQREKERRRRDRMLLWGWLGPLLLVVVAVVAWMVWKWATGQPQAHGAKEPLRVVPSASASSEPVPVVPPVPPVFNQALPTEDAGPLKPPLK